MTKQTRTTLKNYYSTGKVPTQQNYHDLIESQLNLKDTDTQIIPAVSASNLQISEHLGGHITASGNIKFEGYISSSGDKLLIKDNISASGDIQAVGQLISTGSIKTNSHITASGNISGSVFYASNITASGNLKVEGSSSFLGPITHPLTASEDISSSADIYCNTIYGTVGTSATITDLGLLQHLYVNGPTQITGSMQFVPTGPLTITGSISASGHLTTRGNIKTGGQLWISGSGPTNLGHITASGDISSSGTIHGRIISSSGDIMAPNIGGDTDTNNTIILNGSGLLKTRAIDSRVWGTTLTNLTNGVNNRITTATDANSLNGEANLTFNGTTLALAGAQTITTTLNVGGVITTQAGIEIANDDVAEIDAAVVWENDGTITNNGRVFQITLTELPEIPAKYNSTTEHMNISSTAISTGSVIIITASRSDASGNGELTLWTAYDVSSSACKIKPGSVNGTSDIAAGGACTINVVIL